MAAFGKVAWWTGREVDWRACLARVWRALELEPPLSVTRVYNADKAWELVRMWREERWQRVDELEERLERLGERLSLDKITGLELDQSAIMLDFPASPVTERMGAEVRAAIPESLSSYFELGATIVTIGWRDLVRQQLDDQTQSELCGRSFFTVADACGGMPTNPSEYCRRLLEVPAYQARRRVLEEILGPVEFFARWDF
jgi:hypothetical protein